MLSAADARPRRWFGHPPGLTILFLTEMWEVFSLYGMRAILVLYLTTELGYSPAKASLVFGFYAASTYFTPLFGAVVAARWLGQRRSVLVGSVVMAAGHFMMAFDVLLYPALAVIALGNGLFMPNLASQIHGLYRPGDPARERGYNLYYVGVNLGGFLAPLICGTLGETLGWHWGFGAAGVGMLMGLGVFTAGWRHLPERSVSPSATEEEPDDRRTAYRFGVLAWVLLFVVIYRIGYEQAGNTIMLWTAGHVDRGWAGGGAIPVSWFLSLNPLFVFALTPLLLWRWSRKAAAGRPVQPLRAMAMGALTTAAGFLILAAAAASSGGAQVHWVWLVLFFLFYTAGEIQILPLGLAMFGGAVRGRGASLAIAVWFAAAFAGNLAAGFFGTWYGAISPPSFFGIAAAIIALAAAALALLQRLQLQFADKRLSDRCNRDTCDCGGAGRRLAIAEQEMCDRSKA
jgi:POT family proton-dependent oligopeptide transporter